MRVEALQVCRASLPWFINERVDWEQQLLVPTDGQAGKTVLSDLLARYPATEALTDDDSAISRARDDASFAGTKIV